MTSIGIMLYPYVSISLCLIRKSFSCRRWKLKQIWTRRQCTERLWNTQSKWDVFISFFIQYSENYVERKTERLQESNGIGNFNESVSSKYNRTVTHVKLQRLQKYEQGFHGFQPGLVPVLRGNWLLAPIPNQKSISNWQTLEREKLVASNGSSLILKPELRVDCLPSLGRVTQNELSDSFWRLLPHIGLFELILYF